MIARNTQAFLVDRIKRGAFAQLHRTTEGEVALLEMYLAAENLPESEVIFRELAATAPGWLKAQLDVQGADEMRHAEWLRARLAELGRSGDAVGKSETWAHAGFKIRQLNALIERWGGEFRAGRLVPLIAVVLSLETTAVRVMRRHLDVLERETVRTGRANGTAAVLARILADEKRHVLECERALDRLIKPAEKLALKRVLDEADEIDRRLGVTGAVGLFALGLALRGVGAVRGVAQAAARMQKAAL